ncbi:hypothetical protein BDR05DRAFT_957829 [Suillus weaverae]|nr:hypothetical protein BDR05DRAFT_957829 [Suillus weaverae]
MAINMNLYNQKSGFQHVTGFCLPCAISPSIFGWCRISIQPISIMNQDVPGSAINHHRIKIAQRFKCTRRRIRMALVPRVIGGTVMPPRPARLKRVHILVAITHAHAQTCVRSMTTWFQEGFLHFASLQQEHQEP